MVKAHLTINIDGASRGNPGAAAIAYVIAQPGQPPIEEAICIGKTTNNVAEYTALVRALERAVQIAPDAVTIFSDSELLVKQMNGEYRVKNADLRTLFEEAQDLVKELPEVTISHVRREQNVRADELCNLALDGKLDPKRSIAPPTPSSSSKASSAPLSRAEIAREDCILCLSDAAKSWATHGAKNPPPELVWEQLWSILEENGLVK